MIHWNKWTKDYTYTYLWHKGTWVLIHKKKNKPVVAWVKSWYDNGRNRLNDISSQWLKVQFVTSFYTITVKKKAGTVVFTTDRQSKRITATTVIRGKINGVNRLLPQTPYTFANSQTP